MSFFSDLGDKLKSLADEILEFVESFFGAAIKAVEQNGGPLLVQLATDAVAAAEASGGSGGQKLQAAVDSVVAGLKTNGVPVVLNAVNIAVETAVANLKASQASQASAQAA